MKRRNWRQKFDPSTAMIFSRPVRVDQEVFEAGDPVPTTWPARYLRRLWDNEKIEMAEYEAPDRPRLASGEDRPALIAGGIETLDANDIFLWTATGKPRVDALEKAVGFDITAAERNAAWKAHRKKPEA